MFLSEIYNELFLPAHGDVDSFEHDHFNFLLFLGRQGDLFDERREKYQLLFRRDNLLFPRIQIRVRFSRIFSSSLRARHVCSWSRIFFTGFNFLPITIICRLRLNFPDESSVLSMKSISMKRSIFTKKLSIYSLSRAIFHRWKRSSSSRRGQIKIKRRNRYSARAQLFV